MLRENQKKIIKKILESINEGAILIGMDQGIIYFNNNFLKMFDLQENIIKDQGLDYLKTYFSNIILTPESCMLNSFNVDSIKEQLSNRCFLKDGRYFELLITPIKLEETNCILYSFSEKTKERGYSESLRECYEMFHKLIDNVPNIIIIHKDFRCIYMNATGISLLGYDSPKDIQGKDMKKFLTRDAIKALKTADYDIKNGIDIGNSLELRVMNRFKNPLWIKLVSCTSLLNEKDILLSIFKDITREKHMDKLEKQIIEREEALILQRKHHQIKYDFYTSISHEAKTPISIVLAASRMLEKEIREDSLRGKEYIEIINKNCNKMIREINNFIDIEKIQTGYFDINLEECNVVRIIEDITLSVLPYINEKNIKLVFDTEIEEKIVSIDIYLLERVILNLLTNAIKFTEPGGEIYVLIKDLGLEIEVSVKDTGIGISEDNLIHIFERFRQVHKSKGFSNRGSGLGLYLVKGILKMMGGKISIKSNVGIGSIFTITIPIHPVETDGNRKEKGTAI